MRLSLPSFFERRRGLLAVCLVVGIFVAGHYAYAMDLPGVTNFILTVLGKILGLILAFLGKILIIAVDILIAFASYNNFVHSQPVEIGWVLVRDVVNMFFIVVLLLSAFATIIQYRKSDYHYTAVLPKLLLMAILINFSKTLIGLMIDFSQVLMLTFVNAFKQAAGGNFISALQLSNVTTLSDKMGDNTYKLDELIPAAILGVMMLGISLTIIVIMLGFLIFRIIGLWLLLIMSPMAFFATALPKKLGEAMGAFTKDYWDRLSSLLIMGPVMAFFLWLTLAIVQGNNLPFNDLLTNSQEASSAAANFVTNVGDASHIAVFIVVVALLLQGVEFAVKTAGAISPSLGNFAKATAAGGGAAAQLARLTARTGASVGRGAGRAAGAVGGVAFEGVDRLSGGRVRGGIGRAGLAVSGRLGGVGAATFAGMATHRAKAIETKRGELAKATADLDPATRDAFLRRRASSAIFGREASAATMLLGDSATSSPGMKSRTKLAHDSLKGMADGPDKTALAQGMAQRQAAMDIKAAMKTATDNGNDDGAKKLTEAIEKNPSLAADWAGLAGVKNGRTEEDVKKYLNGFKADSYKDSGSAAAIFSSLGMKVGADGKLDESAAAEGLESLEKTGGDRWAFAQKHLEAFRKDPSSFGAQVAAIDGGDAAAADRSRAFAAKDKSGGIGYAMLNQAAPQVNVQQAFNVRNEQGIEAAKGRLTGAARGSDQSIEARRDMMGSGAHLAEAFSFSNADNTFADVASRNEFSAAVEQMNDEFKTGSDKGIEYASRFDTASLVANPNGYNDARAAAVANLDPVAILGGYKKSVEAGNKPAQAKFQELAEAFRIEGQRITKQLKAAGISGDDVAHVSVNPTSTESREVIQRMRDKGVVNPVESVQAVNKYRYVRDSADMNSMSMKVTERKALVARGSAKQAVAKSGANASALKERRAQAADRAAHIKAEKVDTKAEARQARIDAEAQKKIDNTV